MDIINITFKHMDPSDAVKRYATAKTQTLAKYFNGRISVDWNFTLVRQNQIAHIHVVGKNMDFYSEGSSTDLYASIEMAVDKLEKQIRRRKEMAKNHLHRERRAPSAA